MALLTEYDVQNLFSKGSIKENEEFIIEKNTIITPSARSFLLDKNITVKEKAVSGDSEKKEAVYETLLGKKLTEKPEYMTHLRGNTLVFKDHPRIRLRGAIDSLESRIILAQIHAKKEGYQALVEDLDEIVRFIRKMLRCEVSGELLGEFQVQAMTEKELREYSHHPSQYFGMKHFLPSFRQGETVAILNRLRTQTREVELIAYQAFKDEHGQVSRDDLIQGFNRLSSLFWIMMFKFLTGKYK